MNSFSSESRDDLVKSRTLNLVQVMRDSLKVKPAVRDRAIQKSLQGLLKIAITSSWWQDRLEPYSKDIKEAENLGQLLGSLPVLNRATLQENSQWMATWVPGSSSEDYSENTTSGSTGKPVTVTKFKPIQGIEYHAGELFNLLWNDVDLNQNFLSYRTRKPPEKNPAPMGEPLSFVGASGQIYFQNTDQITLDEVLESIEVNQIKSGISTPSALRAIVNRIIQTNRANLQVSNVLTFSGRVDANLRTLTRKHLGARIIDVYSTAEVGQVAFQCPRADHLHPLQILNYVEILNKNDLPCAQGEVGRVVITALGSVGMPLIRYEIGDTARWGEPCEFGIDLPVLEPEIVRVRDTYVNEQGQNHPIILEKGEFVKNPALRDYLLLIFQDRQALFLRGSLEFSDLELSAIRSEVQALTGFEREVKIFISQGALWLQTDKPRTVVFVDEKFPEGAPEAYFSKYLEARPS